MTNVLDWLVEFYVKHDLKWYSEARTEVIARHPQCDRTDVEARASNFIRDNILETIDESCTEESLRDLETKYYTGQVSQQPEYQGFCLAVIEELEARVTQEHIDVQDNNKMTTAWQSALVTAIDRECQYTQTKGLEKLAAFQRIVSDRFIQYMNRNSILDLPAEKFLRDFLDTEMTKEFGYFREVYATVKK